MAVSALSFSLPRVYVFYEYACVYLSGESEECASLGVVYVDMCVHMSGKEDVGCTCMCVVWGVHVMCKCVHACVCKF